MNTPIDHINLKQYTYSLPDDRIAMYPAEARDQSKLLVRMPSGELSSDLFANIQQYLKSGSHLFFNNSKVIPARLIFFNDTGARIEIFCLKPVDPADYELSLSRHTNCVWECMIGNLKKFNRSEIELTLAINNAAFKLKAEKLDINGNIAIIRFTWNSEILTFAEVLSFAGQTPLPPYIKRHSVSSDRERYQTIYSSAEGSVAAPTAGLHFTSEVFKLIADKNISCHEVTLHVGAGTFQPIKKDNILDHEMHAEYFSITEDTINDLLRANGKVTCVGTTTVRTLESLYWIGVKLCINPEILPGELGLEQWECYHLQSDIPADKAFSAIDQWLKKFNLKHTMVPTRLMIVPGYSFHIAGNLITNFHQPGSTLLLLIAAFLGESWRAMYDHALKNGFRFLSFGDSSLLLNE
jgi:S-adenosylmethionine:tRNA ribosyltransferase-isomerase